jgi:RNA polymerase sigma factor (sigma-70 family)
VAAGNAPSLDVIGATSCHEDDVWHNALMRRHWIPVKQFISRQIQYSGDAEDLAQLVLALAWKKRTELSGDAAAWLFVAARYEVMHYRRNQLGMHRWSFLVPSLDDPAVLTPVAAVEPDPADETIASLAARKAVHQILAGVEADDAEILTLAYLHDLTGPEMADVLQISHEAIRARMHRALKRARAYAASTQTRGFRTQYALQHHRAGSPPPVREYLLLGQLPARCIRPGMTVWLAGPPFAGFLKPLSRAPQPPHTAVKAACQAVTGYHPTRSNGAPGNLRYTLSVQIPGHPNLLRCNLPEGSLVYTGSKRPAFLSSEPMPAARGAHPP